VTGPRPAAPGLLVHGMGTELTEPDWRPLTDDEVHAVLAYFPSPGRSCFSPVRRGAGDVVVWRSPRPISVDALLDGYRSVRPLDEIERAAVAEVLPVVQLEYALSELEYFADVTRSPGNAELAYLYLTAHTAWFEGPEGSALLDHLRRRGG
jgi:hypothetical protein